MPAMTLPKTLVPGVDNRVGEFWIAFDKAGQRRKVVPYRVFYGLHVDIVLTADHRFVEETVTYSSSVVPPETGWRIFLDDGDTFVWRRPLTIRLLKSDTSKLLRMLAAAERGA